MTTAHAARGAGRLSDGCGFARDTIKDGASASRRGGDGRRKSF